jgi:hypothetical protein
VRQGVIAQARSASSELRCEPTKNEDCDGRKKIEPEKLLRGQGEIGRRDANPN